MFQLDDDIMRQLRAIFQVEAAEHIQAMNRILLALEENPEGEERNGQLEEIFREAHSLKGAAGAADFGDVESTAHKLESVFGAAKKGTLKLTRDLCDVLYAGIDAISVIIAAVLEDKPHGLDIESLHARLDAAAQGQFVAVPAAAPINPIDTSAVQKPEPAPVQPPPPSPAPVQPLPPPPAPAPVSESKVAVMPEPPKSVEPARVPAEPPPSKESKTVPQARAVVEAPGKSYKGPERRKAAGAVVAEETIRVATNKIDSLMTRAGELLVAGLKIDQRLTEVGELNHSIEDWNREWLKLRSAYSNMVHGSKHEEFRPLIKLMDQTQERLRELSTRVGNLQRGFARDALHLSRVTNDLGEGVMKVRMLPVATVFDAFPRLVRDVARESGKEVELKTEGQDTELDRKVLEEIKDPLIHLLRNSVDHGIESPAERAKAGKPPQGTIIVKAFQKGNGIVIEISDDGAGINRDKVKKQALKNGLISAEEAAVMSDDEALRLIFLSGLSTSPIITDISGRGIGMDVVRRNVEALQGQVDINSTMGVGTTISMMLPLTLATTQELLVQVNNETYGIPISAVERIQRIHTKDISSVEGRQAIVVNNDPVSLVRLADVLERPSLERETTSEEKMPVVILGSAKRRVAFLVDAVVAQQETVVKSLGKQLARVRNVAGASILGTGQIIMTLNPADLLKSARGTDGRQAAASADKRADDKTPEKQRHTILVVDDSLSTRTLEKNILETAGYKVILATDGQEAWGLLSTNTTCDLIVSDVLMPHMNGFELTAAIKRDAKLKKTPVVLVTSLDSRADKEKGIEAGADAYIIKSNFDQANLLQTIAQLI